MELNDWLTIIGAMGGLEAIRWMVTFWVNRKTNARKEDAAADAVENENERQQIDWLEKRLSKRDRKFDSMYTELRQTQTTLMEEVHNRHETELKLKEAEMRRCDVPHCVNRRPPSDY